MNKDEGRKRSKLAKYAIRLGVFALCLLSLMLVEKMQRQAFKRPTINHIS